MAKRSTRVPVGGMKRMRDQSRIGFQLDRCSRFHTLRIDWSQGWTVGLVAFAFLLPGMLFFGDRRHQILGTADLPSADRMVAFRSGF